MPLQANNCWLHKRDNGDYIVCRFIAILYTIICYIHTTSPLEVGQLLTTVVVMADILLATCEQALENGLVNFDLCTEACQVTTMKPTILKPSQGLQTIPLWFPRLTCHTVHASMERSKLTYKVGSEVDCCITSGTTCAQVASYPGLLKLGEEKAWYTLFVHAC